MTAAVTVPTSEVRRQLLIDYQNAVEAFYTAQFMGHHLAITTTEIRYVDLHHAALATGCMIADIDDAWRRGKADAQRISVNLGYRIT